VPSVSNHLADPGRRFSTAFDVTRYETGCGSNEFIGKRRSQDVMVEALGGSCQPMLDAKLRPAAGLCQHGASPDDE
jgi:hypothetical protein